MNKSDEHDLLRDVVSKLIDEYIKAVDDLRAEKNRNLVDIQSQFNTFLLHDKGMAEWAGEFSESVQALGDKVERLERAQIDGYQQLNKTMMRIEHTVKSELAVRRMLTNLVTDIYERLFKERPKAYLTDEPSELEKSADG